MENISKNISYKEATHSNTATRKGIDNIPNPEQLVNMKLVAEKIFQPVRIWLGTWIRINSFFRSILLNIAIGGSKTSQHCAEKGAAIDMSRSGLNSKIFHYIKDNLSFDQLLWEYGDDEEPDWVHASYVSEEKNRNQVLRVVRVDGKTKYIPFAA